MRSCLMDEEWSPEIEDSVSIGINFMILAKNVGLSPCIMKNVFVTECIQGGLHYFQNRDSGKFLSLQNTIQELDTLLVIIWNKSY